MGDEYDFNIKMDDVIAAGHCVKGAQIWATKVGLDWRRLMKDGIPAKEALATGDGQAHQVVEHTLKLRKMKGVI